MSIIVQTNYEKTATKNAYFNADKTVIEEILLQITPSSKKRDIQEAYAKLFSYLLLCRHANKSKRSNWSKNSIIQRTPLGKDNVNKAFNWLTENDPKDPIFKRSGSNSKPTYEIREFDEPVQLETWIFDGGDPANKTMKSEDISWFYSLRKQLNNHNYYLASMFMVKTLIETTSSEIEFPEISFKLKDILQFTNIEGKTVISHEEELIKWGIDNIITLFSCGYLRYNVYLNEALIQCNIDGLKEINQYAEQRFDEFDSQYYYPTKHSAGINSNVPFKFTIVPSRLLIDDDLKNLFEANLIDEIDCFKMPSNLISKGRKGISNNAISPSNWKAGLPNSQPFRT